MQGLLFLIPPPVAVNTWRLTRSCVDKQGAIHAYAQETVRRQSRVLMSYRSLSKKETGKAVASCRPGGQTTQGLSNRCLPNPLALPRHFSHKRKRYKNSAESVLRLTGTPLVKKDKANALTLSSANKILLAQCTRTLRLGKY